MITNEKVLVSKMEEGRLYKLDGDMGDIYDSITFQKNGTIMNVVIEGGDFKETYIWNFDLRIIDMLADENIEYEELDYSMKRYFSNINMDTITLDEFKFVETELIIFFTKFSETPSAFKSFVKLPTDK